MRQAFAVALAAACSCARAQPVPAARSGFLELKTADYLVETDLPQPAAREAVARMEEVRAALLAASWRPPAETRERLRVVLLASPQRLRQYGNPGMSAFYQPSDLFGEPFLILAAEPGSSVVLTHELAHAQHGAFLPRGPRWFFEGLACYLETLRYDADRDEWIVGEPAADRLDWLDEHPQTDYGRVLSAATSEVVSLGGQEGFAFQSASWMLVFYLANERRPQLDEYVGRLARHEDARSAFGAAFPGLDARALAAEAASYRRKLARGEAGVHLQRVRVAHAPAGVQVRALPPGDGEAIGAELYFLSPGLSRQAAHLGEARAAADRALRLDPVQPVALAVQLALAESGGAAPPLARLREAAVKRPDDYRAQMLLAFAAGPRRPDERREALLRAARLAPDNAAVLNALAWHDLTHGRAAEAVPIAQKAAELAPARPAVLDTLASALARSSRCAEAASIEERAVELTADGELRRRLLGRLQAMRAGCADLPLEDE